MGRKRIREKKRINDLKSETEGLREKERKRK